MADIEGLKRLRNSLKLLNKKVQDKITRASMTASLRIIAKAIKSEVPSRWKEGRKAIGFSFRKGKASSRHKGVTFAKAGVGAGIKKARRQKDAAKSKGRGGKGHEIKGVGQGAGNFMWFVLGTNPRETGSKRVGAHRAGVVNKRKLTGNPVRRTGRLKPNPIVKRGTRKSKAAALAAMAKSIRSGIEREAAKVR
jgi:hypothetical protein